MTGITSISERLTMAETINRTCGLRGSINVEDATLRVAADASGFPCWDAVGLDPAADSWSLAYLILTEFVAIRTGRLSPDLREIASADPT